MRLPQPLLFFLGPLLSSFILFSCTQEPQNSKMLTLGVNSLSSNAFICLVERGNARKGRPKKWKSVFVETNESRLKDLAEKKIDIAISAPPSFFRFAIDNPEQVKDFRIIAGINSIQNTLSVIATKSSGIESIRDIRSKRLGHIGNTTDFFKTYFFLTEGVNETSIQQFVFNTQEEVMAALESKKIDAAIAPDETSRRADPKLYNIFFSSVHELSSQIIVRKELIETHRGDLKELIEDMIAEEKELYVDTNLSMEKLKHCYPDSHVDILKDLLRRHELRVLIDESMLAQYALYRKWLLSKSEYRDKVEFIRSFNARNFIDSSILREADYRRVLLK
jgi:ABC-type amino acid transport substrate-binding protein